MPADKSNGSLTDQDRGAASIEQRCASHGSTRNDERYHPAPRNDTQARLMMSECPDLDGKFRVHAASCDGWTL